MDYPLLSQYLQSGIGDLDDLELAVSTAEGGKWIASVKPGWYWFNTRQGYLYVQEGAYTRPLTGGVEAFTLLSTSGTPTLYWAPITAFSLNVSERVYLPLSHNTQRAPVRPWRRP
jgi:hypothetical protein